MAKKRPPNKQSVRNIKRIDTFKVHGWQVHVRRSNKLRTKLFSDRVHGGKGKALVAAKAHRDQLIKDMAKWEKPLWRIKRTPRTNTGHLGVSFTEFYNVAGERQEAVTVTVRAEKGKAMNRKLLVSTYGREQAVKKAVAWRAKMLRERAKAEKVRG